VAVQLNGYLLAARSECLDMWAAGHRDGVPRSLAAV